MSCDKYLHLYASRPTSRYVQCEDVAAKYSSGKAMKECDDMLSHVHVAILSKNTNFNYVLCEVDATSCHE